MFDFDITFIVYDRNDKYEYTVTAMNDFEALNIAFESLHKDFDFNDSDIAQYNIVCHEI